MLNLRTAFSLTALIAGAAFAGGVATAAPSNGMLAQTPQTAASGPASDVSCDKDVNAYQKLVVAERSLAGILTDYSHKDSEYWKLKQADRQIVDGVQTIQLRMDRNHCTYQKM